MTKATVVRRAWVGAVALCVATLVASCGGSDNGSPPPATPPASNMPPASASGSVDGFIAYLKTLVVTQQDTVEPLDVVTFVAPVPKPQPIRSATVTSKSKTTGRAAGAVGRTRPGRSRPTRRAPWALRSPRPSWLCRAGIPWC